MAPFLPSPCRSTRAGRRSVAAWVGIRPVPEAVADARLVVRAALGQDDHGFVYDATLVASELVTNAVRCVRAQAASPRADPCVWIAVEPQPRWVHLRVRDPFPAALPRKQHAEPGDTDGRGLVISAAIAALLWVEVGDADKVVHAVLTRPGVTLTEADITGLRG